MIDLIYFRQMSFVILTILHEEYEFKKYPDILVAKEYINRHLLNFLTDQLPGQVLKEQVRNLLLK